MFSYGSILILLLWRLITTADCMWPLLSPASDTKLYLNIKSKQSPKKNPGYVPDNNGI